MTDKPTQAASPDVVAVLSDIHANVRALEVVLDCIEREGIKRIVNLGDVVGYGPHPRECFEIVSTDERFAVNLVGNHDRSLLYLFQTPQIAMTACGMNRIAAQALAWTRKQMYGEHPWEIPDLDAYRRELADRWVGQIDLAAIGLDDPVAGKRLFQRASTPEQLAAVKKQVLASFLRTDGSALDGYRQEADLLELGRRCHDYFEKLPPSREEGNAIYAHDNLVNPGDDTYTMDRAQHKLFGGSPNVISLEETCSTAAHHKGGGAAFVFLGHLHHAKTYRIPQKYRGQVARVTNVGSVGFARHDPKRRATFAVFAPAEKKPVRLVRLEYAWQKVVEEIRSKGLTPPKSFAPA